MDVKSYLEKYIVRVYDSNGKLVWEEELDRKKDDKFRYDGFNVDLKSSGTYYLCFTNRDGCKGDYTINISMDGQHQSAANHHECKVDTQFSGWIYCAGE